MEFSTVPSRLKLACAGCLATASSLALWAQPATFDGQRALKHVIALTDIGTRPAASASARKAANYLKTQFEALGYQVSEQAFPMLGFEEKETRLSRMDSQEPDLPATAFLYSPSGHLSAEVVAVPGRGLAADFERVDLRGKVALVRRGGDMSLRRKAAFAAAGGAAAVLIYNSEPQLFTGTLQRRSTIPAVALSGSDGERLLAELKKGPIKMQLDSETVVEPRHGINIVATRPGSGPGTLVFGGHYDSVTHTVGADDNASGIAVVLELARVLAEARRPETLVFIGFDGEEEGLFGSDAYVDQLPNEQRKTVKAMFNFDELGAGDKLLVLEGSRPLVERALAIAKSLNRKAETQEMSFGSDYVPFVYAGIPVLSFYRPYPGGHTPQDTPDQIKAEELEESGELALELLKE